VNSSSLRCPFDAVYVAHQSIGTWRFSCEEVESSKWDCADGASAPKSSTPLTQKEVAEAFQTSERFGPILTLQQAAELGNLAPSTLKRKVSEGHFKGSVSRGKPLRFWRNRYVLQLMSKK
jgi:hypothetical protein